ncbi:MAG: glycoside hydrolase family 15 protein [Chloroflexi bacterium]|nr:glycoside hydrolase family 15 protein [Chloroflexota bacterium]
MATQTNRSEESQGNAPSRSDKYRPLEDYGMIGDLHTIALVCKNGSIDWSCLPNFDSPSVFASILDAQKGGFFKIAPAYPTVEKQMYWAGSNILSSRFLSPGGVGEITDFMPIRAEGSDEPHVCEIVRQVSVVRGSITFRVQCFPAFDYARGHHTLKITNEGAVFSSGTLHLGLSSPVKLNASGTGVEAEFLMRSGDKMTFVLRQASSNENVSLAEPTLRGNQALEDTLSFWRRWLAGVRYRGRWREAVERSALTLKLLTYAPTGAIVAAPTTSLPEEVGGTRNWDYRYSWVRDSAFTVYGFVRLGLTREAEHFVKFMENRAQEAGDDGSLEILYGINGEHELPERELLHLEGYRGSSPVRIGNSASKQLQLDIYGELMDSIYLSNKYGNPVSHDLWQHLRRSLEFVTNNWQRKDNGIWEVRGGRQHFVYSKLKCRVAIDRGIRLADKRSFPGDRGRWLAARDAIYDEIMEKGWNEAKQSFVQHYDTDALDASNLLMPLVFFISPTDPRMLSTLSATLKTLVSDSLVYRYQIGKGASDGVPGEEGTFNMCTFWLVEALTRSGRLGEARAVFEKMLTYGNHAGLYAEETGLGGEALGNFPQAFTHMGLISAAFNLDRALGA